MSYTVYPAERLERLKYIVAGCGGTNGSNRRPEATIKVLE